MSTSLVSPVFVGRQAERTELFEVLSRAADSDPQFVLVAGEAGVGKSRLVAELIAEAEHRKVRVLFGQCVELGADGVPFAPLVDALRALARSMPRVEFDDALGPARSALLRLLPNLDPQPDATPLGPIVQGSQLLELVLGMLERLAGSSPVLIVIEDLHWADQSTLDLAAYLVRALRAVPVAVVGTYRSDELTRRHPLRGLLTAWDRARAVRTVTLDRFDREEVAAQLSAILGREPDAALVDTVYDRSEGNAFLVEEVLGVVLAGGNAAGLPQSLRDVLLARVDQLSPGAQRLLSTAAVGGRWVSEQLLLAVSGLEEAAAFAGLREVVEQHLLVVDDSGRGYAFRHALGRDAVYDDMLPGERLRLHAAYGEALSAHPELAGDDRGMLAADLAHHWYVALDLPRALAASVDAADRARERFAPAEALRQLERAMQIWPRVEDAEALTGIDHVEVLRRAAQSAIDAGEVHRTLSLITEAIDELGPDGDVERRAALMERQGRAQHLLGRSAQAIEVLQAAAALLPKEAHTATYASVFAELGSAMFRAGRWDEAFDLGSRAAAAAAEIGAVHEQAEAAVPVAVVRMMRGDVEGGLAAAKAAIDLALRHGQATVAMRGYINISDTLERLGRSADAAAVAAEGRAFVEQAGFARSTGAFLAGNEAESLARLGRYAEAEALLNAVLAADPEGIFAATLLDIRSQCTVRQGRYAEARRDVTRARSLVGDQAELQFVRAFASTEAMLRLADGEPDAALDGLLAELGSADRDVRYDWTLLWLAHRAHAEVTQRARDRGQDEPALDPVFARLRDSMACETGPQEAFRAMCAAELSRVSGRPDASLWHDVADRWRALHRPYELADALLQLARSHVLAGDRTSAESAAAEAHAVGCELQADALLADLELLARQARLVVSAAGAPTPAHDEDELGRFGLTQREREVLAMVAAGRTNPEIAKALYISPKTASVHVSNILAKLGVASRVEAATMAHRLGVAS